ncbi:hypothetical protein PRIPAC_83392 [Pristionchus pacificus]|uniref:Thioredoxin n=1 Tax=Pristionchus pacificus TaxID=54126 RepID=A0A2A6BS86_PRIPA|nr:hypothetical protein PRIPAC_83392 [Pristionchus pacificus]|eukprot:PDM68799.1 Thioredoxin [Pristionchus pacificus]
MKYVDPPEYTRIREILDIVVKEEEVDMTLPLDWIGKTMPEKPKIAPRELPKDDKKKEKDSADKAATNEEEREAARDRKIAKMLKTDFKERGIRLTTAQLKRAVEEWREFEDNDLRDLEESSESKKKSDSSPSTSSTSNKYRYKSTKSPSLHDAKTCKSTTNKSLMENSKVEITCKSTTSKQEEETEKIAKRRNAINWCPPCMKLMGELRRIHSTLEEGSEMVNLKIGTVDCVKYKEVCQRAGIQSYPTSLLHFAGKHYRSVGSHTAEQIVDFIDNSLHPSVVELTPQSFQELVANRAEDETWIVDFFAPWCGPCQQLAPEYQKVARGFADEEEEKLKFGSIDCQAHGHFCGQHGVRGYPTIRAYPHGGQVQHKDYPANMWRNADSISRWVYSLLPSLVVDMGNDFFTEDNDNPKWFTYDSVRMMWEYADTLHGRDPVYLTAASCAIAPYHHCLSCAPVGACACAPLPQVPVIPTPTTQVDAWTGQPVACQDITMQIWWTLPKTGGNILDQSATSDSYHIQCCAGLWIMDITGGSWGGWVVAEATCWK